MLSSSSASSAIAPLRLPAFPRHFAPAPTGSMMISSHFPHPLFPDIIHFSPPIYDLLARTFLFCYVWYHPSPTPIIYDLVALFSSVIPNIVHFSRRFITSSRLRRPLFLDVIHFSPPIYDLLARTFLSCYIRISSISLPDHLLSRRTFLILFNGYHLFLTPILDLLALSSSVISGYHPFLVPMIF